MESSNPRSYDGLIQEVTLTEINNAWLRVKKIRGYTVTDIVNKALDMIRYCEQCDEKEPCAHYGLVKDADCPFKNLNT